MKQRLFGSGSALENSFANELSKAEVSS